MNIFLIEPNYSLGQTFTQALEQAGYSVSWQRSAQAAITAADKGRPDVVVLELQLAGHGGVEFIYEFRSYTDWQTVPIVVHTFVPEENFVLQRHNFLSLGIAAYLYKPATSLNRLKQAISEAALAYA